MRRATILLALALAASGARGQPPDPLVAVRDRDPLALAQAAARVGDAGVIERLSETSPREARRAAIAATPFMVGPEEALAPLAELAAGRDPELAPAAASAIAQVARALDPDALARREVLPETLAPARARLEALAADETARPDIRQAARVAVAHLAAAGVP